METITDLLSSTGNQMVIVLVAVAVCITLGAGHMPAGISHLVNLLGAH